jgi:hypothetical protein
LGKIGQTSTLGKELCQTIELSLRAITPVAVNTTRMRKHTLAEATQPLDPLCRHVCFQHTP